MSGIALHFCRKVLPLAYVGNSGLSSPIVLLSFWKALEIDLLNYTNGFKNQVWTSKLALSPSVGTAAAFPAELSHFPPACSFHRVVVVQIWINCFQTLHWQILHPKDSSKKRFHETALCLGKGEKIKINKRKQKRKIITSKISNPFISSYIWNVISLLS